MNAVIDSEPRFSFLVHDVARLLARRFNQRALLALGLTRAQCRVISYLARNEGVNQKGLAEALEVKPMSLVHQIDRMEEAGWIERRLDPCDRRARRLVLTEKARPILVRIRQLSAEIRDEAFARLDEAEGPLLIDLLRRVHSALSERALSDRAAEGGGREAESSQASPLPLLAPAAGGER